MRIRALESLVIEYNCVYVALIINFDSLRAWNRRFPSAKVDQCRYHYSKPPKRERERVCVCVKREIARFIIHVLSHVTIAPDRAYQFSGKSWRTRWRTPGWNLIVAREDRSREKARESEKWWPGQTNFVFLRAFGFSALKAVKRRAGVASMIQYLRTIPVKLAPKTPPVDNRKAPRAFLGSAPSHAPLKTIQDRVEWSVERASRKKIAIFRADDPLVTSRWIACVIAARESSR